MDVCLPQRSCCPESQLKRGNQPFGSPSVLAAAANTCAFNRLGKLEGYTRLLLFGGFGFGFLDDRKIGIGILPESEEVLVSGG